MRFDQGRQGSQTPIALADDKSTKSSPARITFFAAFRWRVPLLRVEMRCLTVIRTITGSIGAHLKTG